MARTRVIEIAASGIDEAMQGIGADPFGGSSWVGLRVPTLATPDFRHRYLMLLATFSLGARVRGRLLGMRQGVTIGQQVNVPVREVLAPYVVETEVTSPYWHFSDANISWHIHELGPPGNGSFPPSKPSLLGTVAAVPNVKLDRPNFVHNFSQKSALLYGGVNGSNNLTNSFYTSLTTYVPPNAGRPWGSPVAGLGPFYDLRTQSRTQGAWREFGRDGIEIYGNKTFAMFASVAQTNPSTRTKIQTTVPNNFVNMDIPEEIFIDPTAGAAFPNAIYWRVYGSLIVEVGAQHANKLCDEFAGKVL